MVPGPCSWVTGGPICGPARLGLFFALARFEHADVVDDSGKGVHECVLRCAEQPAPAAAGSFAGRVGEAGRGAFDCRPAGI